MDATSKAQKLKSLDRALRLLDILSKTRDPLSAAQISKTLGVKRTASYAMLNTLVEHAYLEKDPVTDNYRIGSRLFELGQRYRYRFPFAHAAEQEALRLATIWRLTVRVGIYKGDGEALLLFVQLPAETPIITLGNPINIKAHACSLGKVLLAYLPNEELEQVLTNTELESFTSHTITDPDILRAQLSEVKRAGYAIDHEEYLRGISCIAAPIRNMSGKTIASFSISGSTTLIKEHLNDLKDEIIVSARAISTALGWQL